MQAKGFIRAMSNYDKHALLFVEEKHCVSSAVVAGHDACTCASRPVGKGKKRGLSGLTGILDAREEAFKTHCYPPPAACNC